MDLVATASYDGVSIASASSHVTGTINQEGEVWVGTFINLRNFITVSDPADVFRLVLTMSPSMYARSASDPNPSSASYADIEIQAMGVDPITGINDGYLGGIQRTKGTSRFGSVNNLTTLVDSDGTAHYTFTPDDFLRLVIDGSGLNSNGIFEAEVLAYTSAESYSPSGQLYVDEFASETLYVPTVTLLDKDGNDITAQHVITQETGVLTTPEPPTLSLALIGILVLHAPLFRVLRRKG